MTGVATYRHVLSEIDSASLDNTSSPPAIGIGATDLNTRALQIVEGLAKIATGSASANWATAINGLPAGADLTTLNTAVGGATAAATPSAIVKRNTNAGALFGGVSVTQVGTSPNYTATKVGGQSADFFTAYDTDGATPLIRWGALGAIVAVGTLVMGSGATAVTDSAGKVLSAALNTVAPAQGGTGVASPTAGNVAVAAGASAMTFTKAAPAGNFVGDTDSQTLTNKTVNGAALAGTLSGTPTFSGNAVFSAAPNFTGVPTFAGGVAAPLGTITGNAPMFNGTAIWNAGGVSFQGVFINVTNTASAAGSTLFDFQVASASKAKSDVGGNVTFAGSGTFGSGAHTVITPAGLLDLTQGTGILPPVNGGTGVASPTANGMLLAAGASAMTTLAPGSANNIAVSDGTHWTSAPFSVSVIGSRTLPYAVLQDLSMSGTGTTMVLTFNGGNFTNSSGVLKTAGGTTITPTATASDQYIPYYLSDTATLTQGTIGATQATASIPTSSATPVQTAYVPANCTAIYSSLADWQAGGSVSTKGYLLPRPVGISGNATASGIQTTATLATIGVPGTSGDTSGVQLSAILAGTAVGTVNGENVANIYTASSIVKTASTDAGLDKMHLREVSGHLLRPATNVALASSTTIKVIGPSALDIAGSWRYAAGDITSATYSGVAATVNIYADTNGAAAGTYVLITNTSAATGTQRLLGTWRWDGAAFVGQLDPSPLIQITPYSVKQSIATASQAGNDTVSVTSPAVLPSYTTARLDVAVASWVELALHQVIFSGPAAGNEMIAQIYYKLNNTGSFTGIGNAIYITPAPSSAYNSADTKVIVQLGAGRYDFTVFAWMAPGSSVVSTQGTMSAMILGAV